MRREGRTGQNRRVLLYRESKDREREGEREIERETRDRDWKKTL